MLENVLQQRPLVYPLSTKVHGRHVGEAVFSLAQESPHE